MQAETERLKKLAIELDNQRKIREEEAAKKKAEEEEAA